MSKPSFTFLKSLSFLLFIFCTLSGIAQNNYTLSGYVKDGKTGEELIGAVVVIKEIPATGVSTNAFGFYSITIPEGNYTVSVQYLGYELSAQQISLKQNIKQNIILKEKSKQLDEVEVVEERKNENITNRNGS